MEDENESENAAELEDAGVCVWKADATAIDEPGVEKFRNDVDVGALVGVVPGTDTRVPTAKSDIEKGALGERRVAGGASTGKRVRVGVNPPWPVEASLIGFERSSTRLPGVSSADANFHFAIY